MDCVGEGDVFDFDERVVVEIVRNGSRERIVDAIVWRCINREICRGEDYLEREDARVRCSLREGGAVRNPYPSVRESSSLRFCSVSDGLSTRQFFPINQTLVAHDKGAQVRGLGDVYCPFATRGYIPTRNEIAKPPTALITQLYLG